MQFAVVLYLLTLLPGPASLTGTWALDRVRSEFGGANAPTRFVLYLDDSAGHLTAIVLVADDHGQRMGYRKCRIERQLNGALSSVKTDGVAADETWQITVTDELTITRVVDSRSQPVRQRLVLARSKTIGSNGAMHADVDHLRLSIEREPDHWVLAVQNRANGAWLYRSRATNLRLGQYVLLDFTSSELGRHIDGEDVTWVKAAQSRLPWAANL